MDDATASAAIRGPCGDEMEFYLKIRRGRIQDIRCHTSGCGHTRMCGLAVARWAQGRTLMNALSISPRQIINAGAGLPKAGKHCAILAVSTLYRAIADYLLEH
ncbi:MAG: hypothetical protein EOM72_02340 [Opitutae bacterium]|nr:hypothetical protein [Opitutae bacterium]